MTLTQKRPRARHRNATVDKPGRLAARWFFTFRWHLLALFLSDLGRSMVVRKYDAFTTDNGYRKEPKGSDSVSRFVDGVVRQRDTHVALRQRLEIVTSELVEVSLAKRDPGGVRLVSGPVGLGRDVRQTWSRLDALGTNPAQWLDITGVDLDASGTVLDEASRLAVQDLVPLETYCLDLLDPSGIVDAIGSRADVFNTIGLSTWLDRESLDKLLASIREALMPDGVLIIDHWREHAGSKYVKTLQMPARYVTDAEFETSLRSAGFTIEQKRVTENEVVVVYRVKVDSNPRAG